LAFTFLQALKDVLVTWNEREHYKLSDDTWHITRTYYEDMRTKVMELDTGVFNAQILKKAAGLGFLCNRPMKVRH
jgi:hypothetical protein